LTKWENVFYIYGQKTEHSESRTILGKEIIIVSKLSKQKSNEFITDFLGYLMWVVAIYQLGCCLKTVNNWIVGYIFFCCELCCRLWNFSV